MKSFDTVVIGAGDVGLALAFKAEAAGRRTALIDKGRLGGTCVNYGCVPSKTIIHAADAVMEIRKAEELGLRTNIEKIDFTFIMNRMRRIVGEGRQGIERAVRESENIEFFHTACHFIDARTIESEKGKIRGKKIFVASGARPEIPPIKGMESVPYITNESVLGLETLPESIIILGGGYIGVEYAHFFSAMGAKVTIVDKNARLLAREDEEISDQLMRKMGERVKMYLSADVQEVREEGGLFSIVLGHKQREVGTKVSAKGLLVATGRKSNADLLKAQDAGMELDEKGFIRVDEFLKTSIANLWAAGDAVGRAMFTHAGDKEAEIAWNNATKRKKQRMNFGAVPHAVFTSPQIASIGLTEGEARKGHDVIVGRAKYSDTVMGEAMGENDGFAKAILDKNTGAILGFHIIGPHSAILIQEVVNAVINGTGKESITGCMHIFPSLSDLIPEVLGNVE